MSYISYLIINRSVQIVRPKKAIHGRSNTLNKESCNEVSGTFHTACRVCDSQEIDFAMEFKSTPIADMFLPQASVPKKWEKYPLSLGLCRNCGYLHLSWTLNANLLYPDFVYTTSTTSGLINHYKEYVEQILPLITIKPLDLIVDIGSNDGSFLKSFLGCEARLLGVEPSRTIAKRANKLVPTICSYFDDNVVNTILDEHGKAILITTNYTFANIDNILGFTKNVARLLATDGLFIVQTGYHPDQMDKYMFDYIYHEHVSYFTVGVIKRIFERSGLEPINVTINSMKGGSIRIVGQHLNGSKEIDNTVSKFLTEEINRGVNELKTYREFSMEINRKGLVLRAFLENLIKTGKRIVGYGASHSTTTLLFHYNLKPYLDYIVDDNPLKQGTVSPGYQIPIHAPQTLADEKEIIVLILAWQHAESIISRNSDLLDRGVKFILPFPDPHFYES